MVQKPIKRIPDRLTGAEQAAFRKYLAGQGLSQKQFAAAKHSEIQGNDEHLLKPVIEYFIFNATSNGYRGNPVCLKVVREFIQLCEVAEKHA